MTVQVDLTRKHSPRGIQHASLPQSMRERMQAMLSVYGSATAPAKDFGDYDESLTD